MSETENKLRVVLTSIDEDFPQACIRIKPISNKGAGYSSSLYEATILTPKENVEIFAKVMAMGDAMQANTHAAFDTENYVYTKLSRAYKKLQTCHGLDEQWFVFPKHYKSSEKDGVHIIVLENLVSKGYGCHDRLKSIDWKYASKCVETLARFHALSMAFIKQCPEEFKEAQEIIKMPILTGSEWNGLADAALAVVDEVDRQTLSRLLKDSVGWSKFDDLSKPRRIRILVHGDYRPSNLMHKEVDGDLHVIPVDYQTVRVGCPAGDFVYFTVLGSDQQFRRQHFHQLVDHYYQHLVLAMKSLGLEPDEMYGREEFDSDLKEKLPIGLCVAAMGLTYVTVDAAHAPNFEDGCYVPRGGNELFAERLRGLMEDFKLWGYI